MELPSPPTMASSPRAASTQEATRGELSLNLGNKAYMIHC